MSTDKNRLRSWLEELERIDRPSASEGERRAAEWLVGHFGELGAEARIEAERAHGTYWWPLGIGAALGALGGILGLRGRRLLGGALAGAAAAGMASDFPPGKRRLRRALPRRTTYNVLCELGAADAERTVVVIAHHDAAHSGLVFHPELPNIADRLGLIERTDTSPALMAPVVGGPVLAALGALTGRRLLAKLGIFLGLGSAAAMAEIGARKVVPGANDNGTAVVSLLALAEELIEQPPENLRVILLSVGSEESFSEGIKAFGERHFPQLPRESTFFLCLESIGSPHLLVLRGEGFLKMRDYPARSLALMDGLAEELGIDLFPNLRLRSGTDGLEPLAAGYETAVLCSCTDLKQPANYHWWHDLAENVEFDTVADGIRLSEAAIRRLDQRWL
ncbi:MAG TPA: M28 family peptidase [Solirubrobacterales bacterium]|nr:M28 family peptidase [Solirubrobacterales bacterium]